MNRIQEAKVRRALRLLEDADFRRLCVDCKRETFDPQLAVDDAAALLREALAGTALAVRAALDNPTARPNVKLDKENDDERRSDEPSLYRPRTRK